MQMRSSNIVKVYSLNREEVLNKLSNLAQKLISKNQNVLKIILFGSLAEGNYSPHSDADLLIILGDDKRRKMDRIPEFLIHFLSAGIGVDIFPFTIQEIENVKEDLFWKRICENGIILAKKE